MKKHIIALSSIAFALSIAACGASDQSTDNANRATGSVALALTTTIGTDPAVTYCVTGDIEITSVDNPVTGGPYTIENTTCNDAPQMIPLLPGDYALTIPTLKCYIDYIDANSTSMDSCELVGSNGANAETVMFNISADDVLDLPLEFVFIDELGNTSVLMSVGAVEIGMSETQTEETQCGDDVCLAGEEVCATIDGTSTCYAACVPTSTGDATPTCPTGLTGTCQMTAAQNQIGHAGGELTYVCDAG